MAEKIVSDEELNEIAKSVLNTFAFMQDSCFYRSSDSADCRHPDIDIEFLCMSCQISICPILGGNRPMSKQLLNEKTTVWVESSGALMVSREIEGVTQKLNPDAAEYYGGKFFVCETIRKSAAKKIAAAMGWEFSEVAL